MSQLNQADIEAGIHCESHHPGLVCLKGHLACRGKLCKDYSQAITSEALEPLPCDYRPRTITNEYGELRLVDE